MKKSTKYLKILANFFLYAVILFCIFCLLPKILVFFTPFVVGFVLALIANPVVRFLESKIRIKRKYGTVLMIIVVIGALVLLCYGTIAVLSVGIRGFLAYVPTMYTNAGTEFNEAVVRIQNLLHRIPLLSQLDVSELELRVEDLVNQLVDNYKQPTVTAISDMAKSIPDLLVSAVMGLLATYFFVADKDRLVDNIRRNIPSTVQENMVDLYSQMLKAVVGYFKAQFKIMGVIYVVITIGLMILRIKYAWLIGFGIAFLDMLPVFGTGTVLIPWAAFRFLTGNFPVAAGMLVLYAVALFVHQLIQPKLVGASVGMDAFSTLFFMFIGYKLQGMVGMIIAIPAGMILVNLYKAGAFDRILWCIREIGTDFLMFCRFDHEEDKRNHKEGDDSK